MKKLFTLLILLLLMGTSSWAQVTGYTFLQTTTTYTVVTGTLSTATGDDGTQSSVPIGFNFSYNGSTQTIFSVTTNGAMAFGSSAPGYSNALASNTNVVAPLWDDNYLPTAGTIIYTTTGTTGSQICTIQWTNDAIGGSGTSTNPTASFQVKLYEGTNVVEIIYGGTSAALSGTTASIGISGASGNYLSVTPNTPTATVSSTTENSSISSATYFPSGTVYRFTPPPPCSAPTAQPTVLALAPVAYTSTQISGNFIAASPVPSGYIVVRYPTLAVETTPVNGTTYTAGNALGLGTVVSVGAGVTFTATGLTPVTTYDFYVYSYNNTACAGIAYKAAGALTGTQTTNGIQSISSTATGGLWSSPATWVSGLAPTNGEDYVIANGAIVTIDQILSVRDLTISGTLQWGGTSYALTASRNVLINSGGNFLPYNTGQTGQTLNIGGDFTNNGFANLAVASTLFNFNGSTQNSSLAQTLGGTGTFMGDGTKGIIRQLFLQTTGSTTINTTQNLVAYSFAHTAGSLNTNGKLFIDDSPQVYGQAINNQVANVAVTNMGTTAYVNAPVVFGASVNQWIAKGTPAVASRYFYGSNVYLCTAVGSPAVFGSTPPTGTGSTTFADSTSTLLYIGTLGTIGNPYITGAVVTGTQYFYNNNLYVAINTTGGGTTPPTHTSGTVGSFQWIGNPATVSINYDAVTKTVRSLNLVSAGNGYISSAPTIAFSLNGGTGAGASATAVLLQSIIGPSASQTQKSTVATITGGLNIASNQGVGAISTTNGGVNYSAAPSVGFPLPTNFQNLVLTPGSGYTGTPTVAFSGGTMLTGGTNPTVTVTVAQGIVVSAYCTSGGTGWQVPPTITLSGGGATTQATLAFPANCLATATATITNGTITGFTVTNSGSGYPSAPTPMLVTNGTVTTAATAPACRVGLYNLIYNFFGPATSNPTVTVGAEVPTNNRINVLTLGGTSSSAAFASIKLAANLELYAGSSALTFPTSTSVGNLLDLNGNTLTFSHPSYGGATGSLTLGSVKNGPIVLTSIGGPVTKNFPFDGTFTVYTGSGTGGTGSNITTLTANVTGAPSGTGNPIGTRSFRLQVNSGAVLGTSPTVTLNYNVNDALVSDAQSLFVSQAAAVTGGWTVRSVTTGTGPLPATGSRTTAISGVGPITADQYFAWSSTYVAPPALSYNITRTTHNAFTSIISTGTVFAWNSTSTDDNVTTAVTIPSSTFTFQGQIITGFNICTNGWMHLISTTSLTSTLTSYGNNMALGTIPDILAPFWDDLIVNASDGLTGLASLSAHTRYQINGSTAGSRQIICEWNNYSVYGAAGPQLTFQIILDETDNSITYNYGLFQGFNGTNNHRYTYSCGIGGLMVNAFPLPGQVIAQQYENTTAFSYQYANNTNYGANAMSSIPECSSSIKFTPGVYAGFTPPAQTPPINDEAANAITIPALLSFPANLCGNFYTSRFATKSSQKECAGNNDDDVWFKFVATRAATTVRVYGSGGYIARVQVLNNALGLLTTPVCVVASAAGNSIDALLTGLTIGNTYYVRVYHDGGGTQATATAVVSNGVISYLNWTNPGSGYSSTTTGGQTGPRVTITGGGGSDAEASATITSGSVSGYTLYGGYGYTSAPTVTIESPAWAHIGEFAIVVYAPSVNDDCSGAIALTGLSTPGCTDGVNSATDNTQSATPSSEAAVCGTPDDDLWYKFVAVAANTEITVSATGGFDPAFQVFDGGTSGGSCSTKTSVACINVNGAGVTESVLQATTVGHTYFIRVYHAGAGTVVGGTYTICVTSAQPACVSAPTTPVNNGNACIGTVLLSWPADPIATGYDVFLDPGTGPATTQVATNQAGTTFTTAALAAGAYSWRVIPKNTTFGDATGCADFYFTIHALPTVVVTPSSQNYCAGNTAIQLTASGAATYAWSPASGLDATTGAVVHANPTVTTTYTVIGTDTYGCTASATSAISVLTPLQVIATATPTNICAGNNSVLTATASVGSSATYCTPSFAYTEASGDYLNNFTFADITNNNSGDTPTDYTYYNALTAHVVADGVTPYTISCEAGGTSSTYAQQFRAWIDFNQDGIFEESESVFFTVNATYSPTVATGTVTIPHTALNGVTRMRVASEFYDEILASESCYIDSDFGEFEDYNVSITGGTPGFEPGGVTYTWSPATYLSSTTGSPVTATGVPSTITYTVTASLTGYCPGTATATVTISTLTCGALTPGGATPCDGIQTVDSHVSGGGLPYVYLWTKDGLPYGGNTASVNATLGTHSYVCHVTDACNNTCSSTLSVTTHANPTVAVLPVSAIYCKPNGPAVTLSASGAYTYVWTPVTGLDATTGSVVNASPSSAVTYKVTGSTAEGCTGEATTVISVSQSVTMTSVTATPPAVDPGGSSTLAATASIVPVALNYCVPTSAGVDCLTGITFNTLVSTPAACVSPYYRSNPATGANTTTVMPGNTYPLTVNTNSGDDGAIVSVWIDYNNDGVFDASEWQQVYTTGYSGTINITIPAGAVNAITGMRVRSREVDNINGAVDACTTFGSGSCEDYQITIGTPSSGSLAYTWSPATFLSSTTGNPVTANNATATTTYTVTASAAGCSATGSVTLTVNTPTTKTLNLKVYLESLYPIPNPTPGVMQYAHNDLGDHQFAGTVVDVITVVLRDPANDFSVVNTQVADLNENGTATLTIPAEFSGSYYITIKHRNSVETCTAEAVSFATSTIDYDFTTAASMAFGDNQKDFGNGKFGIYAGDVDQDGGVGIYDMGLVENASNNFAAGYLPEDVDGDGSVGIYDMGIIENNSNAFVGVSLPY